MKKILTTIVIVLFVSSISYSQFRMKVGPNTGMNFNIGTGSDVPQTLTGFGFVVGAQVDMNFSPMIGIITNIQFYDNRSGSSNEIITAQDQAGRTYPNTNYNDSWSVAYFMIEPLFKLSIPRSGFFFNFGPMVGFNIEATNTKTFTNATFQKPIVNKSSLKDMLVRFGIKAGAGYDINLSRLIDLTPQFNFEFGITNIRSNVSSRILTFQILLATKFRVL